MKILGEGNGDYGVGNAHPSEMHVTVSDAKAEKKKCTDMLKLISSLADRKTFKPLSMTPTPGQGYCQGNQEPRLDRLAY